jgi:quercetin dioxygenase-like cupin family protein
MKLSICVSLMLCIACAQEITEKIVPITQEPSHHLVLENRYVRVFNVEVAPHFTTRVHRHDHDYLFVTLGDSDVSNERVHAEPVELKLRDGETHFTAGGFAHKAVNLADTPFHNITIEFVEAELTSRTAGNNDVPTPTNSVGSLFPYSQTFGKINVREGTFLNGEISTCTGDRVAGPQLLVPVSQFFVKSGTKNNQMAKPGDVVWFNAGDCPTIVTRGNFPARFVLVNFPEENNQK